MRPAVALPQPLPALKIATELLLPVHRFEMPAQEQPPAPLAPDSVLGNV